MTSTWAEDRATRARDPSADPGARPDGATRCRPLLIRDGTKAINAPAGHASNSSANRSRWFASPPSPSINVWGALDYASCGAAAGPHPRPLSRRERRDERWGRSDGVGPVISIRASPIRYGQPRSRSGCLRTSARHADSTSFELTRRFPQRTTSADKSGVRSQEILNTPRRPFVADSVRAT